MSWDHTTCFTLDTLTLLRALERKEKGGILNFSEKEREAGGRGKEGEEIKGKGREEGEGEEGKKYIMPTSSAAHHIG